MHIKNIINKLFNSKHFNIWCSLQLLIWYCYLAPILIILKNKDFYKNKIAQIILFLFLQGMVTSVRRLEKYSESSIPIETIFGMYEHVWYLYRLIEQPQKAIPMYEYLVQRYPTRTLCWHRLATCYFWIGDVPALEKVYLRYVAQRAKLAESIGLDIQSCRYFSSTYTSAIGHICILGFYSMRKILDGVKSIKNVLHLEEGKVVNSSLLNYITPMFEVVTSLNLELNCVVNYLDFEDPWLMMRNHNNDYKYFYDECAKIVSEWESKKMEPLLKLSQAHIEHGWNQLSSIGIPGNAWFVALHVRDAKAKEIRHGNVLDYIPAIEKIVSDGGWVIRLGDSTMPQLPAMAGVIDYAHSEIKSDRMDVFLIGACKFFISTNSGPAFAPGFFGKRSIQTNYAPLMYNVPYSSDILLPMLFRSKSDNKLIPFRELLLSPYAHAEYPSAVSGVSVDAIKNSPEELLAAVIEMLEIVNREDDSELRKSPNQKLFQSLCKECNVTIRPLLSEYFMSNHIDLLR